MKNLSYILIVSVMFNTLFSLNAASAAEVVKGGGAKSAAVKTPALDATGKPKLTPEEMAMGATQCPYPACSGQLMVEASNYQKHQDYWKAREKSCDPKVASCNLKVQVVADSGMFASRDVVAGKNVSAVAPIGVFLDSVRVEAAHEMAGSIKRYDQIYDKCLSGKTKPAECEPALKDVNTRLTQQLPAYRNAIATMYVPINTDIEKVLATGDVSILINEKFQKRRMMVTDYPKMEALSKDELAAAKKELEAVLEQGKKDAEKITQEGMKRYQKPGLELELKKFLSETSVKERLMGAVHGAFNQMRGKKMIAMNEAIMKAPELRYVGTANASDAVLAAGLRTMIADSKGSLARINKAPVSKDKLNDSKVDPELLQYAVYSQLIDKMLAKEIKEGKPSSCAAAMSAYNQLKTDEGRTAALKGLALAGGTILAAFAGPEVLGAIGVGTGTATAASSTLAFSIGLIGGGAMTLDDVKRAENMAQDNRSGLVTADDAKAAKTEASIGVALSPLDFMGGGAALGTLAGAGAVALSKSKGAIVGAAARAAEATSNQTLSRWGASAVANQELKVAAASAARVKELAAEAEKAQAKAAAKTASEADKKAALEASAKVEQAGDKAVREFLGREFDQADKDAFERMAKAGFLGKNGKPDKRVVNAYKEKTKLMSASERKQYSEELQIMASVAEEKAAAKAAAKTAVDPERNVSAGELGATVGGMGFAKPQLEAVGTIMNPASGWPKESLDGARAVVEQMKKMMGTAKTKTKETVESTGERFKQAYAKLSGKKVDDPEVLAGCKCFGMCPVKVGENESIDLPTSEPRFMACVAH